MFVGEYDMTKRLDERSFAIFNAEVVRQSKSVAISYILWFFLYWTGAHRFYLGGRSGWLYVLSFATVVFYFAKGFITMSQQGFAYNGWLEFLLAGIGGLFLVVAWFYDLFTIPSQVESVNRAMRARLLQELLPPEDVADDQETATE